MMHLAWNWHIFRDRFTFPDPRVYASNTLCRFTIFTYQCKILHNIKLAKRHIEEKKECRSGHMLLTSIQHYMKLAHTYSLQSQYSKVQENWKLADAILINWNWPQWEYFWQGNWQMLQIRTFPHHRVSIITYVRLPAENWISQSYHIPCYSEVSGLIEKWNAC